MKMQGLPQKLERSCLGVGAVALLEIGIVLY